MFKGFDLGFPLFAAEEVATEALVIAADAGEFTGDLSEFVPAFFGVADFMEGVHVGHEFGGDHVGDEFGEIDFAFVSTEVVGLFGGGTDLGADFLVAEPIDVAAFFPFGEVLLADGVSGELGGDEFLDFGESVEPLGEDFAFFAVFEAPIKLFTDVFGKAGDFSSSSVHGKVECGLC